jgi:predicted dienelactone hydrolase
MAGACRRRLLLLLLLAPLAGPWLNPPPATAAAVLELRLDGLRLPVSLEQLEAWSRQSLPGRPQASAPASADLAVWLNLLDSGSRADLIQLLRAPLLRDTSFGRQLLDSWAGSHLLAEVGDLLTDDGGGSTTPMLQATLRQLLERRREVTTIELLRAMPVERLSLQLDGLLTLAQQWRQQLQQQRRGLRGLQQLELPRHPITRVALPGSPGLLPRRQLLTVAHRREPLPVDLWLAGPGAGARARAAGRPWVLLMPGLGGNAEQFAWLAAPLAEAGWPVAVLQHPGSDGPALAASLAGKRPPPGPETLSQRLEDGRALLALQRRGGLPIDGDGVVLMGHSLGAVTALLAAGLMPEPGLEARCRRALEQLAITNPSWLLQCQLPAAGLPRPLPRPGELRGLVLFNSFGSLLWPGSALRDLPVPVMLVGGSLDLITPPLTEQLRLFLPAGDRRSRLVLVDGGSHFSAVRLAADQEALFRLGDELVGHDPASVQALMLGLTQEFLESLRYPLLLPSQRRLQQGVTAYVLDPAAARRWQGQLGR